MAQCFARNTVLTRDRTTDFADDFQFRRVFAPLLSACSHLLRNAVNLARIRHIDENAVGEAARESGHFGAECREINRNRSTRGLESHFEILRRKKLSCEAEFVTPHRCTNNLDIFFYAAQRPIETLAVPLSYGGIGGTDAEQESSTRALVQSYRLERQGGWRAAENMVNRGADL